MSKVQGSTVVQGLGMFWVLRDVRTSQDQGPRTEDEG